MEHEPKSNPLMYFSQAITALTRWATDGGDTDRKPAISWDFFTLNNLAACFTPEKPDDFLTDAPLQQYFEDNGIVDNDFTLQGFLPEGIRVTQTVLPCTLTGLPIYRQLLSDKGRTDFPYYQVFISNPSTTSGMALGLGGTFKPAPYLLTVPEEIRLQTSFVVEYLPGFDRREGESDYKYLTRVMTEKHHRLQELIKGRM